MADIRNITILPAQSVSGVPQVQGSTGTGAQGTAALSGLAPGTVLSGFIVNRDATGNPILRTAGGDIAFSSSFFLNIGSVVEIRVENNAAGTLAHLLSVNGQPPEVATSQSAFAQEPEVIVSQNLSTPQSQPQAATAATITAAEPEPATTLAVTGTLIATPQQQPADAAQPALPAGTQLTLKITGLNAPPPPADLPDDILNYSPAPSGNNPSAGSPPANPAFYSTYAKAAGVAPSPVPVIAAPAAPPAPAVPVAQIAMPNAPQAQTAAQAIAAPPAADTIAGARPVQTGRTPSSGAIITATVISNDSSQETHLQTPIGLIRLQPETVLPSGSTVTLEITDITTPEQATAASAAASAMPAPLTELAQQWTSLQQIVGALSGRDAPTAFNFIQNAMPWVMPPPSALAQNQNLSAQNIPAGLMLFMAALRGGNFSSWLGEDNVQWLQAQGHSDLLKKTDSEFMAVARQFTEAVTASSRWQPLFFPVAVAGELHQARLFVKRDRKQGGNTPQGRKNDETRFVVEVDLTQLGEMQMDGFVRRRDKDVQFDLIIRSLAPLPGEIQNDILQIYNNTGELAGYKGSLAFQTVRDFPVNPMEELGGHMGPVVA